MSEFNIKINDFLGKNLKADPLDHSVHEAQTVDRFSVSVKPGALVKDKGMTDQASVILPASYPSNWTIKNFFQFRVTKPSTKQIMIVHATVGGEDRIYVDYTYNGSAWVQGWVELTENEENIAATASTDGTNLYSTNLASSTNDYYNGWYVFNWTRRLGSIVSDFTGATQTLILQTAITSQVSGDKFSIWRFPMVVYYEGGTSGYTAATGSSTTQLIDLDNPDTKFYELNQEFDDAYNGWTLWNTTAGDTQAITDHESLYAGDKQRLTHAALTGQTDGDTYFLYNPNRALTVDDKIIFDQTPNTAIMTVGNSARFPKQYPVWYGFIRNTYYFATTDNTVTDGFYAEAVTLDAPDDEIIATTQISGDIGITDSVYVAAAYVYDGYQVGPMTSVKKAYEQVLTSTDGNDDVRVGLSIGYSAKPNMRFSRTLNKRITGVIVYAATDLDTSAKTATWHRVRYIPIREDFTVKQSVRAKSGRVVKESNPRGQSQNTSERSVITPGGRFNHTIKRPIRSPGWTGTDPYSLTFDIDSTLWANKTTFYTLDSGGMNGDMINYAYRANSHQNNIAGKLFVDNQESSLIAASPIIESGTPAPDWFPLETMFDMANYGISQVNNIRLLGDYLYILGDSKSIRMLVGFSFLPTFRFDTEYEGRGFNAPLGIVKYKNSLVGVFKDGVFLLGNDEQNLSYQIEDITSRPLGVSDLTEAYALYAPQKKEFMIAFPTDSKLFIYDLNRHQWAVNTLGVAINSLVLGINNEIYGASSSKIYRLDNGTTDDSTSINPQWKSKVYSFGLFDGKLREFEITYKSNTVFQLDVYFNRGGSKAWPTADTEQIPVSATVTTIKRKFPSEFRGAQVEFGFQIPSANRAANTSLEIYEFNVIGTIEERI